MDIAHKRKIRPRYAVCRGFFRPKHTMKKYSIRLCLQLASVAIYPGRGPKMRVNTLVLFHPTALPSAAPSTSIVTPTTKSVCARQIRQRRINMASGWCSIRHGVARLSAGRTHAAAEQPPAEMMKRRGRYAPMWSAFANRTATTSTT
jgi:hypothetical protein